MGSTEKPDHTDRDAQIAFAEEQREAELSPAQPDDAHRIDGSKPSGRSVAPPAVKHEGADRMQN